MIIDTCFALRHVPTGTVVRCPFDFHGLRSEESGLGPYVDNWYDLTIVEGKIVYVDDHIGFMTNWRESWELFAQWVVENYPDDAPVMYTDASLSQQRFTEASVALWEQRTREYVTVVGN